MGDCLLVCGCFGGAARTGHKACTPLEQAEPVQVHTACMGSVAVRVCGRSQGYERGLRTVREVSGLHRAGWLELLLTRLHHARLVSRVSCSTWWCVCPTPSRAAWRPGLGGSLTPELAAAAPAAARSRAALRRQRLAGQQQGCRGPEAVLPVVTGGRRAAGTVVCT